MIQPTYTELPRYSFVTKHSSREQSVVERFEARLPRANCVLLLCLNSDMSLLDAF